ncbi:hypothetical protein GCM10009677_33500 [Sphaerisporangium rubeum]|uniref:Amino acid adenylation domain-containing protein n=1 Tax=Sphaerisporangium rubeum TaxID=321317 RepID=A0A7X0IH77_9ACTN|nr:non-ribosomal peptide synthetase [Sphaerisporangium rubeum]MBB6474878.1 amino acid adenylation domain-containing protein [Sphaerisporangium rubeum]
MTGPFEDDGAAFPRGGLRPLPEMLAERAGDERPAIVCGDEVLTYARTEARVNRLANFLRARGVRRGDLVGVLLERGTALPVALLAVLKAGAAYVPLNPRDPGPRIGLILEDARPAVVLTEGPPRGLPPGMPWLDVADPAIGAMPATPPEARVTLGDLAYVIFTSGSTGRPKGVAVPHGALVNFLVSMAARPGMPAFGVLVAVTTPSFDIAALELFLPLTTGGTVVVADSATTVDGARLRALLARSGATHMQATPATWRLLRGAPELAGLTALVGGEAVTPDVAGFLLGGGATVWNMYGPTETTIWSTVRPLGPGDLGRSGPMPIGRPIRDTTCHVLDGSGLPVPDGEPGELYIGGGGLARGYHGRAGLTASRFVPDPFGPPGARLYRTGDLARFLPCGDLEYLGRTDHQVKIRGHRVETGEIEAHLAAHPSVDQAVVTAHDFGPADRRLVAYVTPATVRTGDTTSGETASSRTDTGADPDPALLRTHLAERLPAYMVPGIYLVLPEFPLTPNRKVDRKALPEPVFPAASPEEEPLDARAQVLTAVVAEVLGVAAVAAGDNFIGRGGDSVSALTVVRRAREAGLNLTAEDVLAGDDFAATARRALPVDDDPAGEAAAVPLVSLSQAELDEIESLL